MDNLELLLLLRNIRNFKSQTHQLTFFLKMQFQKSKCPPDIPFGLLVFVVFLLKCPSKCIPAARRPFLLDICRPQCLLGLLGPLHSGHRWNCPVQHSIGHQCLFRVKIFVEHCSDHTIWTFGEKEHVNQSGSMINSPFLSAIPNSSSKKFTLVPLRSSPPSAPKTSRDPPDCTNLRIATNSKCKCRQEWSVFFFIFFTFNLVFCELCPRARQHKNPALSDAVIADLITRMAMNGMDTSFRSMNGSGDIDRFRSVPHISALQRLRMCRCNWRNPAKRLNSSFLHWSNKITLEEEGEESRPETGI